MFKINNINKKSAGFSIIELVISIAVLTMGVVGVFSAFSMIAILTSDSVDRLIGTYLAQEGMEIVRNIRDTNWLEMDAYCNNNECTPEDPVTNHASWVDGLTSAGISSSINCDTSSGCEADYKSVLSQSSSSGNYLCIDLNGLYFYQAGCSTTKYKRRIIISPKDDIVNNGGTYGNHLLKVRVEVSWDKKATILDSGARAGVGPCLEGKNCIATEETLYNWYNDIRQ